MSIYIQSNIASMNAQNNLAKTQNALQTTFAHLSSGYRINSASDDAAGLGISESFGAQIRSFGVAERNANDGISLAQTADGAAAQVGGLLSRMRELATQASNGVLQTGDLANLDTEYQALTAEIDRIAVSTKFNGNDLLNAAGTIKVQVGIGTAASDQVNVAVGGLTTTGLAVSGLDLTSMANAQTAITALDTAIGTTSQKRAGFGVTVNRLQVSVSNIQSMRTNLSAANSRIKDVDVAEETAQMARQQVLSQAGAAVLAQANQAPQLALSLLRG